jgi:hypothetical protein
MAQLKSSRVRGGKIIVQHSPLPSMRNGITFFTMRESNDIICMFTLYKALIATETKGNFTMQDSSPRELRFHRLHTFTPDELAFITSHTKGTLTLKVPCPSIGSTQSYQDIASDLLMALFIGETAAEFCKDGSFYEDWDEDESCKTMNFVLTPQNPAELAKKLHWLSNLFADAKEEEDEGEKRLEVIETVSEFRDQLGLFEKKKYYFPLLLDDYFANYMRGLSEDSEIPEDISEVDQDDPIQIAGYIYQRHHYIRALYPHDLELEIYCSAKDSSWIILSASLIEPAKLKDVLAVYRNSLSESIELQEASVVATQSFDTVVFNHVEAVKYPFEQLIKAQECVAEISFLLKKGVTRDPLKATKVKKNRN